MRPAQHPGLLRVLGEAQRIGALGSAPLSEIIEHSVSFADALPASIQTCVDLGSGAGIPGLVIALVRPEIHLTLIDRRSKRTDTLSRSVQALGFEDHVTVVCGDVRDLRHREEFSRHFDAACSRGFGPPLQTLQWAVDLVCVGGLVVVSEPPPGNPDRWAGIDISRLGVRGPTRLGSVALFHVEQSTLQNG